MMWKTDCSSHRVCFWLKRSSFRYFHFDQREKTVDIVDTCCYHSHWLTPLTSCSVTVCYSCHVVLCTDSHETLNVCSDVWAESATEHVSACRCAFVLVRILRALRHGSRKALFLTMRLTLTSQPINQLTRNPLLPLHIVLSQFFSFNFLVRAHFLFCVTFACFKRYRHV